MFHVSAYAISLFLTPDNLIIVNSLETETRLPSCFAFPVIDVNKSYLVLQSLTSHKVSEPYSKWFTAASISTRPPFWCHWLQKLVSRKKVFIRSSMKSISWLKYWKTRRQMRTCWCREHNYISFENIGTRVKQAAREMYFGCYFTKFYQLPKSLVSSNRSLVQLLWVISVKTIKWMNGCVPPFNVLLSCSDFWS